MLETPDLELVVIRKPEVSLTSVLRSVPGRRMDRKLSWWVDDYLFPHPASLLPFNHRLSITQLLGGLGGR